MSDRNPRPMPQEHPGLTPERNVEAAVRDSFPASDPPAETAAQGVRAVPPETMAREDTLPTPGDAVRVTHAFHDAEAAKLALETLVREVPLDRRCAEMQGTDLVLRVSPADARRIEALLHRASGDPVP